MKEKLIIPLAILTCVIIFFVWHGTKKQQKVNTQFTIAIVQTTSHPALDASRQGFMDTLEKEMQGKVQFLIYNAEGSITTAHAIAQSLRAHKNIDGIFAIATLAAQAIAAVEKQRPIFIAAVTDPVLAGLRSPNSNVCGSSDFIESKQSVTLIKQFLPTVNRVALLYNVGEVNSTVQIQQMELALRDQDLTAVLFGVSSEADIASAVFTACKKADVLLLPNDNTLSSTITLITSIAKKQKIPLFASDNLLVQYGVFAARGVDYYENGVSAARCAEKVLLNDVNPAHIPISSPALSKIFVNKSTMELLKLNVPETLQDQVIFVETEKNIESKIS